MNLTYRGVSFQALVSGVNAVDTAETGIFRGRAYAIKRSPEALHPASETLIYRGVRYVR